MTDLICIYIPSSICILIVVLMIIGYFAENTEEVDWKHDFWFNSELDDEWFEEV